MKAILSGCGIAGFLHALSYRAAGVSIAAVFDADSARAKEFGKLMGALPVRSFDELVMCKADFASVCGPPPCHVNQVLPLADGRTAVFVEKPVATSHAQLTRLTQVSNCVPIVQWRAGRGLQSVRKAVVNGWLGEIQSVSAHLVWSRDDAYLRTHANWGCGALLSVGIHAVDAICWVIGRPVEHVSGALESRNGSAMETRARLDLGFEEKNVASVRVTFDEEGDTTRIIFIGPKVTAIIAGGEEDPTASNVEWICSDPRDQERLEALEAECQGARASPLIVPFMGKAIGALARGGVPGTSDDLPSLADVLPAHRAILDLYERPSGHALVKAPPRLRAL